MLVQDPVVPCCAQSRVGKAGVETLLTHFLLLVLNSRKHQADPMKDEAFGRLLRHAVCAARADT